MSKAKRGRPKKFQFVSVEKALLVIRDYYLKIGVGPDEVDRFVPAKGTLYNRICAKDLKNYGTRKRALLSVEEVEGVFCK